jgi:hypothetical protein
VDPNDDDSGDDDDLITYNITMFSMSAVGVPLMVIGVCFMAAFSFLLPSHEAQRYTPHGSIQLFVKTINGKMVNLVDVLAGDVITVEDIEKLSGSGAAPSSPSMSPTISHNLSAPTPTLPSHKNVESNRSGGKLDEIELVSGSNHNHNILSPKKKIRSLSLDDKAPTKSNLKTTNKNPKDKNNKEAVNEDNEDNEEDDGVLRQSPRPSSPPFTTSAASEKAPLWASSRDMQPENQQNGGAKTFKKK